MRLLSNKVLAPTSEGSSNLYYSDVLKLSYMKKYTDVIILIIFILSLVLTGFTAFGSWIGCNFLAKGSVSCWYPLWTQVGGIVLYMITVFITSIIAFTPNRIFYARVFKIISILIILSPSGWTILLSAFKVL